MPVIMLISVDLPLPELPITPTNSPRPISRSTPRKCGERHLAGVVDLHDVDQADERFGHAATPMGSRATYSRNLPRTRRPAEEPESAAATARAARPRRSRRTPAPMHSTGETRVSS